MKIGISHAAWGPGRRESLRRLIGQLAEDVTVSASQGPEHTSIWSRRIWEWAARQDEHVLILQDDVLVHPELRKICEAMIEAAPDEVISLHTQAIGAASEEMTGHHWARCYWWSGPAVIVPPARIRSLLAWIYARPWWFLSRTNEDVCAIHWAWGEQRPFWCAIPAPVIHDTELKSTYGYDAHPYRVPSVPWSDARFAGAKLTDAAWWRVEAAPPCIENPWMPVAAMEHTRRVLAERGAQLCTVCFGRQGVVGVSEESPRLCFTCATRLYNAAVAAAQEAR